MDEIPCYSDHPNAVDAVISAVHGPDMKIRIPIYYNIFV